MLFDGVAQYCQKFAFEVFTKMLHNAFGIKLKIVHSQYLPDPINKYVIIYKYISLYNISFFFFSPNKTQRRFII